ncbi:hypothetical protein Mapa_008633 [Marchantia paleacea]|nr:hypothetical protein Mapa_008633 [Marchantia paleacea]
MKIAFSALSLILLRITNTNCPTVKSAGTRYFFLSMSGMSLFSALSTITGILSGYLLRILDASACLFSSGCSFLNELLFPVILPLLLLSCSLVVLLLLSLYKHTRLFPSHNRPPVVRRSSSFKYFSIALPILHNQQTAKNQLQGTSIRRPRRSESTEPSSRVSAMHRNCTAPATDAMELKREGHSNVNNNLQQTTDGTSNNTTSLLFPLSTLQATQPPN